MNQPTTLLQVRVLEHLEANPMATSGQVASALQLPTSAHARDVLQVLWRRKLVGRTRENVHAEWHWKSARTVGVG